MTTSSIRPFRAALVQMDLRRGDRQANRAAMLDALAATTSSGAELVVFPECALSGYVFDSAEEAMPAAETVPGETTEAIAQACQDSGAIAIFGLLERDPVTGALYNSAAVVGRNGVIGWYRKTHLPVLGIDRCVRAGPVLRVMDLPFARIGLLICYDVRFPEAARTLAVEGADILVVPTNWPAGADSAPEFLTRARAWENRVYVLACNRTGTEAGTRFIGRSQIVTPDGAIAAEAPGDTEAILYAEIDPAQARRKKLVFEPGVFELDPIGGRRPELYRLT